MKVLRTVLTAIALCATTASAFAQQYPSKPIRIIVGFAPGGGNDSVARFLAAEMQTRMKQTVMVENRPGVGGQIGAAYVSKEAPDGYTLYLGSTGANAVGPNIYQKLNFDPINGLAAVSIIAKSGNLVVVNAASPFKSVRDIVAYAKQNPKQINFGSSGNGSTLHLAAEVFQDAAGVEFTHVPYKGDSAALTDLSAGNIHMTFSGIPPALTAERSGKVRILAVTSAQRMSTLPKIPTVAESGVPGMDVSTWYGLFATGGTPQPILEQLAAEVKAIVQQPAFKEKLAGQGVIATSSTPTEFRAFVNQEIARWGKVVKQAKITVE